MLLIMSAYSAQLNNLEAFLDNLAASIWLRDNYQKTSMSTINTHANIVINLNEGFGWGVEILIFTYLNLPIGTTKPRIEYFMYIVEGIERRLSSINSMLAYSSR
jgi:hypothetical protein